MRIPNPLAGEPGVPFSGWRVVLRAVLANGLGTGLLGFYGLGVAPLIDEFGATQNPLGLGLFLALTSVGMSMYGFLPVKVLIVNWFVRNRGTALAFAYATPSQTGVIA